MIGDVGGFHDAINLIFEFFMAFYAPGLFLNSLIKSLFKVDLFTPGKNSRPFNKTFKPSTKTAIQIEDDSIQALIKKLLLKLTTPSSLPKRLGQTDIIDILNLL